MININLKDKQPNIRHLYEMIPVLYDQKWAQQADPNQPLYYMYRGIKRKNGLRYDITVIPTKLLGNEFVKTKGHRHIGNYQELYEIIEGEAIVLIQKEEEGIISDIQAIKSKPGDIIIIPSNYAHITINPGQTDLKMGNWVSENCHSDYQPIEKFGGAGYFYTTDGWIKNRNYSRVAELKFGKPLAKMPSDLSFLKSN